MKQSDDAGRKLSSSPTVINVTSHNQSGGITAHTVNVQNVVARMGPNLKAQILREMPRDRPIQLEYIMGDKSGYRLAQEIFEFLQTNGFALASKFIIPQPQFQPIIGVQVIPDDEKHEYRLFVGEIVNG